MKECGCVYGGREVGLSRTLDSNTAVCLGAWAAAVRYFPTKSSESGEEEVGKARVGALEEAVEAGAVQGMREEEALAQRNVYVRIQEEQERERGLEAALNALDALLAHARAALAGRCRTNPPPSPAHK